MAKTRLSIFLVKQGVESHDEILNCEKVESIQKCGTLGVLYGKKSRPVTPKWLDSIFGSSIDSEPYLSSSVSAVYITEVDVGDGARLFALTFGYGHTMLNPGAVEERFGLKTVLSVVREDSLRKISRTTVAGDAKKTNEQLPIKSAITDFSMDVERDLLDGVTAAGEEGSVLSGSITGTDRLNVSVDLDVSKLAPFLRSIYEMYQSQNYKKRFSWLDQISSVKDPVLKELLNSEAIRLINSRSPDIWMAVPEVISWENTGGFQLPHSKDISDDILIDQVVSGFGGSIDSIESLKSSYIKMLDADCNNVVSRWSLLQCLYGELNYDGGQYCITNSRWYHIDSAFAERVEESYRRIPLSTVDFPPCPDSCTEGKYNKTVVEHNPKEFALMDAANISYGGGGSKVELCDLLGKDGKFVHVKHYYGSSVLSHLFNQGLVSATLVKSDSQFREKAMAKMAERAPDFDFVLKNDSVKEVVYGIITKDRADRPRIPFFSKVTLDYATKRLATMNIPVSIGAIVKEPPAANRSS